MEKMTAREELYNHLKHLVEPHEAEKMIEEYKEEVINEFADYLKSEIYDLSPSFSSSKINRIINIIEDCM